VQHSKVIIVGGGLAGLYAASKLEELNIPYLLLEAQSHLGGRIKAATAAPKPNGSSSHDLGPTWIFPHQSKMQALAKGLQVNLFEQYAIGDVLFQAPNSVQPKQIAGAGDMQLFRVEAGMYQLIDKLYSQLVNAGAAHKIKRSHWVNKIEKDHIKNLWQLTVSEFGQGQRDNTISDTSEHISFSAEHLLLALPPRIIQRDFAVHTWGSALLEQRLRSVPTWMAAQAKFIATYPRPFWREKGLSGQAFSQVGPMVEIHDASATENSGYALFGFIGIPAIRRKNITEQQLIQACLDQLAFFYGDDAYSTQSCHIKDWSQDPFTATEQDINESAKHPEFNYNGLDHELQSLKLYLAASEFARHDPGYLEGALDAAERVIEQISNDI
tara:strand:+ start:3866 stop:5014 length:1149 start_codon:yes stop_codon:yes gene_type:complete